MPFGIRRKNGQWEVYNKDTGSVKGKHGQDKAKAKRQLTALNINAKD